MQVSPSMLLPWLLPCWELMEQVPHQKPPTGMVSGKPPAPFLPSLLGRSSLHHRFDSPEFCQPYQWVKFSHFSPPPPRANSNSLRSKSYLKQIQTSQFQESLERFLISLKAGQILSLFVLYLWSFCHWTFAACYLLIVFKVQVQKNLKKQTSLL